MTKFKVGDKVVVVGTKLKEMSKDGHANGCSSYNSNRKAEYLVLTEVGDEFSWNAYDKNGEKFDSCAGHDLKDEDLRYYKNNKTNMNIKEKFIQAFLAEPEKTFRKAGITNGDGLLTEDGQNIFLSWLLKKNGEAFKAEVADELVKEEE